MKYLIDGYNLLFYLREQKNISSDREKLIETLVSLFENTSIHATIVFDNRTQISSYPSRLKKKNLEIIYTSNDLSADDFIVEEVEKTQNKAQCTVITKDSQVIRQVKLFGAQAQDFDAFFKMVLKKKSKRDSEKTEINMPNYEFDRWLKIFERRG